MDESAKLARDRRLYRGHAATFFAGLLGWLVLTAVLATGSLPPVLGACLFIAASLCLVASGILAMIAGRTLLSPRADAALGPIDPYESDGDALMANGAWNLDGWGNYSRATAPLALLIVGLIFLGLSCVWLVSAIRGPADAAPDPIVID